MNITKSATDMYRAKHPYIKEDDLEILYMKAYCEVAHTLFPFKRLSEIEDLELDFGVKIYELMEEMTLRGGFGNAVTYKENGMTISFENSQFDCLKNLVPYASSK